MMFLFGEADAADHWALSPANLTTLPHFSVSSAMTFVKSAGVPGMPSPPRSANARLEFWIGEACIDCFVELVDDLDRHALRPGDAFKRRRLIARQEIADRRQVRQRRRTGRRSHRQCANLPGLDERQRRRGQVEHDLNLSAHEIDQRRCVAAVRHVHQIDAGHHLEQLAGHMQRRADAARAHVDLARIGLGVGDELRNGLRRQLRIHHHHLRDANDAGDRFRVTQEIEIEMLIKRGVDGVCAGDQKQRVAVCRRLHHRLGRDVGAGARPIIDDELLAEPLRQPFRRQPRHGVGGAAGRKTAEDMHRARRIGVGARRARQNGQRGCACGEAQKIPTVKSHGDAPCELGSPTRRRRGYRNSPVARKGKAPLASNGTGRPYRPIDDVIDSRAPSRRYGCFAPACARRWKRPADRHSPDRCRCSRYCRNVRWRAGFENNSRAICNTNFS